MSLSDFPVEGISIETSADRTLRVTGVSAEELTGWIVAAGHSVEPVDVRPTRLHVVEEPLSRREQTIIAAIGEGLTNQEISDREWLSINTVKSYIRTSYRKMGVTTRSEAVRWAIRNGLASVD